MEHKFEPIDETWKRITVAGEKRRRRSEPSLLWDIVLALIAGMALWALAMSYARGAPAPMPKPVQPPAPPVEMAPGEWVLEWAGTPGGMPLTGGGYAWADVWEGTWYWDADKRVFGVVESLGDGTWYRWEATLSRTGRGTVRGDFAGTRIRVRKAERLKPRVKNRSDSERILNKPDA